VSALVEQRLADRVATVLFTDSRTPNRAEAGGCFVEPLARNGVPCGPFLVSRMGDA